MTFAYSQQNKIAANLIREKKTPTFYQNPVRKPKSKPKPSFKSCHTQRNVLIEYFDAINGKTLSAALNAMDTLFGPSGSLDKNSAKAPETKQTVYEQYASRALSMEKALLGAKPGALNESLLGRAVPWLIYPERDFESRVENLQLFLMLRQRHDKEAAVRAVMMRARSTNMAYPYHHSLALSHRREPPVPALDQPDSVCAPTGESHVEKAHEQDKNTTRCTETAGNVNANTAKGHSRSSSQSSNRSSGRNSKTISCGEGTQLETEEEVHNDAAAGQDKRDSRGREGRPLEETTVAQSGIAVTNRFSDQERLNMLTNPLCGGNRGDIGGTEEDNIAHRTSPKLTLAKRPGSSTSLSSLEDMPYNKNFPALLLSSLDLEEASGLNTTQIPVNQPPHKRKYTEEPVTAVRKKAEYFEQNFFLEDDDHEAYCLVTSMKKKLQVEGSVMWRFQRDCLPLYKELLKDVDVEVKTFEGEDGQPIRLEDKMSREKLIVFLKLHKLFNMQDPDQEQFALAVISAVEQVIWQASQRLNIALHEIPPERPLKKGQRVESGDNGQENKGAASTKRSKGTRLKTHTWRGRKWEYRNRLTSVVHHTLEPFLGLSAPVVYVTISRFAYYMAQVKKRHLQKNHLRALRVFNWGNGTNYLPSGFARR